VITLDLAKVPVLKFNRQRSIGDYIGDMLLTVSGQRITSYRLFGNRFLQLRYHSSQVPTIIADVGAL
jgi:hypothetical protein